MALPKQVYLILEVLFLYHILCGDADASTNNPCRFLDSVNITSGTRLANGSYLYDGDLYPLKYIGVYDYEYLNSTHKVPAAPHWRGCICKMKKCVRMCCEDFQEFDVSTRECKHPGYNVSTIVAIKNGEGYKNVAIKSIFGLVYGRPCLNSYFLEPLAYEEDKWDLFKDGKILRSYDQKYFNKDEYCLSPTHEGNETKMYLNPMMCFTAPETDNRFIFYGIAVYLSVPFMIITFIIYAAIPELRNLHGKSLCCYLFALALGYSCLGYMLLKGGIDVNGLECKFLGSITYYSFMASFLWLSIISFDLWWNFRSVSASGSKREWKRFLIYSTYSWGLALVFLIMVLIIQNSNIPEDIKPGIGGGDNCFLNIHTWMQMVYFYGQLLATISFNTTVFVLTMLKIHQVNKEMRTMMARGESRSSINREKDKIVLFLRLFIIMGVTWSLEFVAWLCGQKYEFLFYITDICNATQGLLIFILFILRKRVKKLLINRYNRLRGIRQDENVTRSSKISAISMSTRSVNGRDSGKDVKKGEAPLMSTVTEANNSDSN